MNFLGKARKKVEDAVNDAHAAATNLVGGRVHPGMFQGPQVSQGHYGQYPAPVPHQNQWQQPQYQYGQPGQAQQYHSLSSVQPPLFPSPALSPTVQYGYIPPVPQQYYAPTHMPPAQNYAPPPLTSPVFQTPFQSQNSQPVSGQLQQRYTPSPTHQQYYVPPSLQPQQVSNDPSPAYKPDINGLLGGPRPSPPALPLGRLNRAHSFAVRSDAPPTLPPRRSERAHSDAVQTGIPPTLPLRKPIRAKSDAGHIVPPANILVSNIRQTDVSSSTVVPSYQTLSYSTSDSSTVATSPPSMIAPSISEHSSQQVSSKAQESSKQPYSNVFELLAHDSSPQIPYVFELPAHDSFNQPAELAASEIRHSSDPLVSISAIPKPLTLPTWQCRNLAVPLTQLSGAKLSCVATEGTRTTATKFHVPKTGEDFSVCDHCYQTYLAPLASCFEPYAGPESTFVCDLSFERVQQIVLTQCAPHVTIDPIRNFVKIVATMTPCCGKIISSPGPMWTTCDAVIPGLAVCTTCFELHIRLTPFATHFETKIYPETRDWSCDMAEPYIKRLLRNELSKTPVRFVGFVEEANAWFKLPPCTGIGKPIAIWEEKNKYLMLSAKEGTGRVCLSCWSSQIELTPREDDWELVELVGQAIGEASCDLAGSYSKLAMNIAIKRGDTAIWRNVVGLDGRLPSCYGVRGMNEVETAKEIQEKGDSVRWYQMIDAPTVLACSRCYWLAIQLFGASHLFSPMQTLVGDIRQCSWTQSDTPDDTPMKSADGFENSLAWRGRRLRTELTYGYDTGDWTRLQLVAASVAKEPPACAGRDRGLKSHSGRKWFGRVRIDKTSNDDCTVCICEDCFTRTVKGRPGETLFNVDLTDSAYRDGGPGGFACQTYTNRARSFVQAAADTGNLAPFAQYWNDREILAAKRNKWLPVLLQQNLKMAIYNQQTSLQTMLKGNAMTNALSKKAGAGIVEAVSGETRYRYGNSQIGYGFMTQASADAAMDWNNAVNMQVGSEVSSPNTESMRLHALWEVDNRAFLAVE